jgi:chromosome segregation ATPase
MDEKLCVANHKRVDEKIDVHERRLNNHSERIDKLEQYQAKATVQIESLCKQIKTLVTAIWSAIGLTITTLLGFFIWYVQNRT